MQLISNIRLVDGPVLWVAWIAGVLALIFLFRKPGGMRFVRWLVFCLVAVAFSIGLVVGTHWLLVYVISFFPDEVPVAVLVWIVPPVLALLLWLTAFRHATWRARLLKLLPVVLVAALSAVQVNAYFGLNRTVADLTGVAVSEIMALESGMTHQPGKDPVPLTGWKPAGDIPADGGLRTAQIPGTESGLATRDAYIYFPPAYFAANRPALPVLVLMAGQPGGPADWLTGGSLRPRMDSFAAQHGGAAPVVVVVDSTGSQQGNNLCMDSSIARADTYLSRDVPAWISSTLDVDLDHARWAVGGFSYGATCALQMVTRHPEVYADMIAFSSEREPALAKERQKTVDAAFGGDTAAFDALVPLTVMSKRTFPGQAAYFAAGAEDPQFVASLNELVAAAQSAGFSVRSDVVAGVGHSWDELNVGMPNALAMLSQQWGWTQ